MRKLIFILMLAASFGLGLSSQALFANGTTGGGLWIFPKANSAVPEVRRRLTYFYDDKGNAVYDVPDGWKLSFVGISSGGNIWVKWKKRAE